MRGKPYIDTDQAARRAKEVLERDRQRLDQLGEKLKAAKRRKALRAAMELQRP